METKYWLSDIKFASSRKVKSKPNNEYTGKYIELFNKLLSLSIWYYQ